MDDKQKKQGFLSRLFNRKKEPEVQSPEPQVIEKEPEKYNPTLDNGNKRSFNTHKDRFLGSEEFSTLGDEDKKKYLVLFFDKYGTEYLNKEGVPPEAQLQFKKMWLNETYDGILKKKEIQKKQEKKDQENLDSLRDLSSSFDQTTQSIDKLHVAPQTTPEGLYQAKKHQEEFQKSIPGTADKLLNTGEFEYIKRNPAYFLEKGDESTKELDKYLKKNTNYGFYDRQNFTNILTKKAHDDFVKELRGKYQGDVSTDAQEAAKTFTEGHEPGTFLNSETGEKTKEPETPKTDEQADYLSMVDKYGYDFTRQILNIDTQNKLSQEKDALDEEYKQIEAGVSELDNITKEIKEWDANINKKGKKGEVNEKTIQKEYDALNKKYIAAYKKHVESVNKFNDRANAFNDKLKDVPKELKDNTTAQQRLQDAVDDAYLEWQYWENRFNMVQDAQNGEGEYIGGSSLDALKDINKLRHDAKAKFEAGARMLYNHEGPTDIDKNAPYIAELFGRSLVQGLGKGKTGKGKTGEALADFNPATEKEILMAMGQTGYDIGVKFTDKEKEQLKTTIGEGIIEGFGRSLPSMVELLLLGQASSIFKGALKLDELSKGYRILKNPVLGKAMKIGLKDPIPTGWEVARVFEPTKIQQAIGTIGGMMADEMIFAGIGGFQLGAITGMNTAHLAFPYIKFKGQWQWANPILDVVYKSGLGATIGMEAGGYSAGLIESAMTDRPVEDVINKLFPSGDEVSKRVLQEFAVNSFLFGGMGMINKGMSKQNTAPMGAEFDKFGQANWRAYFSPKMRDKVYKAAKDFEEKGYPESAKELYTWLDLTKDMVSADQMKENRMKAMQEKFEKLPTEFLQEQRGLQAEAIKVLESQGRNPDFDGTLTLPIKKDGKQVKYTLNHPLEIPQRLESHYEIVRAIDNVLVKRSDFGFREGHPPPPEEPKKEAIEPENPPKSEENAPPKKTEKESTEPQKPTEAKKNASGTRIQYEGKEYEIEGPDPQGNGVIAAPVLDEKGTLGATAIHIPEKELKNKEKPPTPQEKIKGISFISYLGEQEGFEDNPAMDMYNVDVGESGQATIMVTKDATTEQLKEKVRTKRKEFGVETKKLKPEKELTPEEIATEEKNNHNRLVELQREYNGIPVSHTKKRNAVFTQINRGVSKLGYSISSANGKLVVVDKDHKPIKTIAKRTPQEEINKHKNIDEYEADEFKPFAEDLVNNRGALIGIDAPLSPKQIDQGISNIKNRKKTVVANDLLDYIEKSFNEGVFNYKKTQNTPAVSVPIEDVKKLLSEDKLQEFSNTHGSVSPENVDEAVKAGLLTEEEKQTYLKNIEDEIKQEQEARDEYEKSIATTSEQRNVDSKDTGIEQGKEEPAGNTKERDRVLKEIDEKIADKRKAIENQEKLRKAKLKELRGRVDLFGETNKEKAPVKKTKPTGSLTYYSMPESDGSFISTNGNSTNEGRSYYGVDSDGEVWFVGNPERLQRAINRLESYIRPLYETSGWEIGDANFKGVVITKNPKVDDNGKLLSKGKLTFTANKEVRNSLNEAPGKERSLAEASNEKFDPINKNAIAALKPFNDKIAALEKEIADLDKSRETAGKEASGHGEIVFGGEEKKPTETKKPVEPKKEKPKPTQKLEDFGEKIGGARKDYYANYVKNLKEITDDDLKSQPLSKVFPEPNYKQIVADGLVTPEEAAFMKYFRDQVAKHKPRKGYKLKTWLDQAALAIDVNNWLMEGKIFDGKTLMEKMRDELPAQTKEEVFNYIDTMIGLGFPESGIKSTGGYKIVKFTNRNDYSIIKGRYIINDYPTKKEAIEGLKKILTDSKEKAKGTKFDVWEKRGQKGYYVGKKIASRKYITLQSGFKTSKEAFDYIKENQQELEQALADRKFTPPERREFNAARKGRDYRQGKNVTPKMFQDTFGFRGTEFGNWVNQAERQGRLNDTYDSLMDLSYVLGLPAKTMSLNGTLSIAFGARGHGGKNPAAAHYEPDRIVINLTKKNGAGSLAHEWWHGLDNYFSRMRNEKHEYVTNKPIVKKKTRPNATGTSLEMYDDESIRPEVIDAFKGIMTAIEKSGLKQRSKNLDLSRTKDYWSTNVEMSARSFEAFVINEIAKRKESNDFLANIKTKTEYIDDYLKRIFDDNFKPEDSYPYPTDKEIGGISKAFDKFFDTVKTERKDGRVVIYRKTPAKVFFSNTDKALRKIQQNKATPEQWKAMLLKNGAKQTELDWMGYDEFMEGKKSVTREELQGFIDRNKVELEEEVKTDEFTPPKVVQYTEDMEGTYNGYPVFGVDEIDPGFYFALDEEGRPTPITGNTEASTIRRAKKISKEEGIWSGTRHSAWQTEGGENYKEWIITMPVITKAEKAEFRELDKQMDDLENKKMDLFEGSGPVDKEAFKTIENQINKIRDRWEELATKAGQWGDMPEQFVKEEHFKEPNIVTHVRTSEYMDTDGNKVLVIQEIQNDWQQAGRKYGFATSEAKEERLDEIHARLREIAKENNVDTTDINAIEKLSEENKEYSDLMKEGVKINKAVPDMPFKKSDQIIGLGIKRMIRYAAENGFDSVAWTTGDVQADRYDLSKQVDSITFQPKSGKKGFPGTVRIYPKGSDRLGVIIREVEDENQLEGIIGKEPTKQIVAGNYDLKGLDLKVGGEGMHTYYDKMIPQWVNKYIKKWGSKVGMTEINGIKLHYFDVTDSMISSVIEGQPMFKNAVARTKQEKLHKDITVTARKFENKLGVPITVLHSTSELPLDLQEDIRRMDFDGQTPALFDSRTGKVFVITDHNTSVREAEQAMLHEVVGHKGLRNLLGDKFHGVLEDVYNSMPEEEIKMLEELYDTKNKYIIADEYLAFKSEGNIKPGFIKRAIAKIRELLRKFFNIKFSESDIYALLDQSKRLLETGRKMKKGAPWGAEIKSVMFSKKKKAPAEETGEGAPMEEEKELKKLFDVIEDTWIGNKDVLRAKAELTTKRLQSEIKDAYKTAKTKDMESWKDVDQAIFKYNDLKGAPEDFDTYYESLPTPELKRIARIAHSLPDAFKKAAREMQEEHDNLGQLAFDHGVINNLIEFYVPRKYKSRKKGEELSDAQILSKFELRTDHAKKRVLSSILEAESKGLELRVKGATNNLEILKKQILTIIENQNLISVGLKTKSSEGRPVLSLKKLEGYKMIDHPNFKKWVIRKDYKFSEDEKKYGSPHVVITEKGQVVVKMDIYAPKRIADILNNHFAKSRLYDSKGVVKETTRANGLLKQNILSYSFFHHLAYTRSFILPGELKKLSQYNVVKMYKEGRRDFEAMTPMAERLIRNGLTYSLTKDWDELITEQESRIAKVLNKTKATKAAREALEKFHKAHTNFLFGEFGVGLKFKAAILKYEHLLEKHPDEDPDVLAKMVARLINADFGGLHRERLHINKTLWHLGQLTILAPDWTVSNILTMTRAFTKKGIERKMYQKFWLKAAMRISVTTVLLNLLMAAIHDDDDEALPYVERVISRYKKALKDPKKLNWLKVDVTPVYDKFYDQDNQYKENRKYFNLAGHFFDLWKFISSPSQAAKAKTSVIARTGEEFFTGTNWQGRRFTTFNELMGTDDKGRYLLSKKNPDWKEGMDPDLKFLHRVGDPKGGKFEGQLTKWNIMGDISPVKLKELPAFLLAQLRGWTPIPMQNLIGRTMGELEWWDVFTHGIGIHVNTKRFDKKEFTKEYSEIAKDATITMRMVTDARRNREYEKARGLQASDKFGKALRWRVGEKRIKSLKEQLKYAEDDSNTALVDELKKAIDAKMIQMIEDYKKEEK